MAQLGSLQDNDKNSFKIVSDNGVDHTARRVDDPITHDKLDDVITALGAMPSNDTDVTIFNVAMALANTEYSQLLPANTKTFFIKARNSSKLKLAYASGGTSSDYLTVNSGFNFSDDNFYASQTLYFSSSVAGEILEIVAYV